jgi:putative nucleotidyltransferase with HDIG domain
MSTESKTREDAWKLLNEYTKSPALIQHSLAVEAAMRHYARLWNEDEEVWGMVGLLHDFDYETYPTREGHPYEGQKILAEAGFSPEVRQGIMAHAPHTGTPRVTKMHHAVFAVDELCGFIVAVALVRPSKKLADVEIKSVKKKMKQAGFAKNVSRQDIELGAKELEISLEEHIGNVLEAMKVVAPTLGL